MKVFFLKGEKKGTTGEVTPREFLNLKLNKEVRRATLADIAKQEKKAKKTAKKEE